MNRRFFLRGAAGAVVGLPFLPSLLTREARAAAAPAPKRFACFFNCNGVNMDQWFPVGNYGALTPDMMVGTALEPVSQFASKMLVPRGIHSVPRGFGRDPTNGDDHAGGMGHKLTAAPLSYSTTYAEGISVDQAIANHLHPGQAALSLSVGTSYNGVLGHISYTGPDQPVVGENNPWLAYQDLFGVSADPGSEGEDLLVRRRQSVLDLVRPEYEYLLSRKLSASDREKLDMHFSTIRDLEGPAGNGVVPCSLDAVREGEIAGIDPNTVTYDSQYKTIGAMQIDILAIALACGAAQSATLLWGSGAGGPIFTWDGMTHQYNHHKLSHGNTQDDNGGAPVAGYEQMLFDIDVWHMQQLALLVEKLDSYPEGNGTVLDNMVLLYANELSDGLGHSFMDLPFVLFGSNGGYFKQGEYQWLSQYSWANDSDAPHNKLLTTLCNSTGMNETHFGSPDFGQDGEFEELKA